MDIAREWIDSSFLDVIMIRYNAAHRSAAPQVLDRLSSQEAKRQGIVVFKSTAASSGPLWNAPRQLPADCWVPDPPNLYRYALSSSVVDVCLTACRNRGEIDQALDAVRRGRLTPEEVRYLEFYGDLHRGRASVAGDASDALIRR
jgi:hypothetical protein